MKACPLSRRHLLSSTALQFVVVFGMAPAAHAQLAANARPTGGTVVAGSASISASANATTINQTSNRAAINWQSFDVGSNQSVEFQQPSSTAVVLNRVTGPDPSAIAGRIDANGEVIITNPSGVVFSRGAQVNAQSLVVSAAGITNQNFMAGHMVFDQAANPNARIVNRGTITVRDAGLAALVAPSVRNSGVIRAKLGRVVLAGATTETLDMYGDGLVSLDVGSEVKQVPIGRNGKPVSALVTNTGTIVADGGTVELTAAAADGVVQRLVDAGGTIRADSVGTHTGAIEINGTGGAVVVDGTLAADGSQGARGTGDAGTIAIGTDLARAQGSGTFPTGTSATVVIAPSARVSANATKRGRGGRVTVLSTASTVVAGQIAARGGPLGGNGGTVELSGENGFALTGSADTGAALGQMGTIVLDPTNLTIVGFATADVITPGSGTPSIAYTDGGVTAYVSASAIEALTGGTIDLQAQNDLTVEASLYLSGKSLLLEAGNDLTVDSGVVINAGAIDLEAAAATAGAARVASGALTMAGQLEANTVTLGAGSGGITLAGTIEGIGGTGDATSLTLATNGPVADTTGDVLSVVTLEGSAGSLSLEQYVNVGTLGALATGGTITLDDAAPLTVAGPVVANGGASAVTLQESEYGAGMTLAGDVMGSTVLLAASEGDIVQTAGSITAGTLTLSSYSAALGGANAVGTLASSFVDVLTLNDAGSLTLAGVNYVGIGSTLAAAGSLEITGEVLGNGALTLAAGTLGIGVDGTIELPGTLGGDLLFQTGGPVTEGAAGVITAYDLGGTASAIELNSTGNVVNNFAGTLDLQTAGDFSLADAGTLTVGGGSTLYAGGNVTLVVAGLTIEPNGSIPVVTALGTVTIAPLVAGTDINVTADDVETGGLELTTYGLGSINAPALGLGSAQYPAADIAFGGTAALGTMPFTKLVLDATGSVTQSQPLLIGTLAAGGTLAGSAGTLTLDNGANAIGTLDGFVTTPGSIDLATAVPLTVAGTVAAAGGTGDVALATIATADTLSLAGLVEAGMLNLVATGDVVQTGGAIHAGTLAGYAPGFSLAAAGNTIATLADLTTTGALLLASNGGLLLSGDVEAATATLDIGGALTADTGLYLTIGELSGSADSVAIAIADANDAFFDVGTLGDWTTSTGFALENLGLGETEGEYPGLTLAGSITDGQSVSIASAGPVTVTGQVHAPTVSIEAVNSALYDGEGGATTATDGTLDVAGGGGISATTSLALTGDAALTVAGGATVASDGALTLTTGGAMTLAGTIAAPSVALVANAGSVTGDTTADAVGITQTLGAILAGTLSGFSSGSLDLAAAANSIDAIGTLTSETGLTLRDAAPTLDVVGLLADLGEVVLSGASAIRVDGTLNAATISLQDVGAVTGTGAVLGETLLGTATALALTGASNSFDVLGQLLAPGGLSIVDTAPLTATGTVSVGTGATLAIADDAFAIGTAGALVAPGGTIVLAPVSAGHTLVLGNDPAAFAETLVLGSTVAGDVTVAGSVDLTGVSVLDLLSAGTVGEAAGAALTVGTLEAQGASVVLDEAENRIATLGAVAATGPAGVVSVADGAALGVAGPVTAPGVISLIDAGTLTVAGSITAPTVDLSASAIGQTAGTVAGTAVSLVATDGALALSGGAIVAAGGSLTLGGASIVQGPVAAITAGVLTATGTGAVALEGTTNAIGTLASLAGSALTLADDRSLVIAGLVTTPGSLVLDVNGSVSEAVAASVTAAVLAGSMDELTLAASGNDIAGLGTITDAGGLSISDAVPVSVAGVVAAVGTLSLLADTISFAGGTLSVPGGVVSLAPLTPGVGSTLGDGTGLGSDPAIVAGTLVVGDLAGGPVTIEGSFDPAGVDVLDLLSAGAITETASGGIAIATLETTGSSITLAGSANRIATLGTVTATGGSIAITDASPTLAIDGVVSTPGSLVLADATGSVTEGPAGVVSASVLSGTASALDLGSATNSIGTLAALATGGAMTVVDDPTLVIAGASAGTTMRIDVTADPISIVGQVSGTDVSLIADGAITEGAAGGVIASVLSATAPSLQLTSANNSIAALGAVDVQNGLAITDDGNLALTGAVTAADATFVVGGSISQPGGTLDVAGLLTGSASGAATFGTGGGIASVGTLGSFSSGTTLALADDGPLVIAGTIAAPDLAITAVGSVTLAGGAIETTGLPASAQLGATAAAPGSSIEVLPDANGDAGFSQTGTTTLAPYGTAASTLRIGMEGAGTLSLENLVAPDSTVVLAPGRGAATGNIDLGGLVVVDGGGSASLTGRVADQGGALAAEASGITPAPEPRYRLNDCEIGTGCSDVAVTLAASGELTDAILTPDFAISSLVAANAQATEAAKRAAKAPLLQFRVLDLAIGRDAGDTAVELPNISSRDY